MMATTSAPTSNAAIVVSQARASVNNNTIMYAFCIMVGIACTACKQAIHTTAMHTLETAVGTHECTKKSQKSSMSHQYFYTISVGTAVHTFHSFCSQFLIQQNKCP
jgi:hypothetical protein